MSLELHRWPPRARLRRRRRTEAGSVSPTVSLAALHDQAAQRLSGIL